MHVLVDVVLHIDVVRAVDGDASPRAHGQHRDADVGGVDEVYEVPLLRAQVVRELDAYDPGVTDARM